MDNVKSHFDRVFPYHCSHRQAPSSGEKGTPAVVKNGNVIYFSHPIFSQYYQKAPSWCKTIFLNALEMLLPEPMVEIEAPSTAIATLNEQADKKRMILHVLHYIPERRGVEFDTIEEVIPLYEIHTSIQADRKVKKVKLVPENRSLEFEQLAGKVAFTIPKINGHQMVELGY